MLKGILIGFAFVFAPLVAAEQPVTVDIPVLSDGQLASQQVIFRFVLHSRSDSVYRSDDGGATWTQAFEGWLTHAYLPSSSEIDWNALAASVPAERRETFVPSEYSLRDNRYELRLRSGFQMVLSEPSKTFYFPWMGEPREISHLAGGFNPREKVGFNIISVRGGAGEGGFLFVDTDLRNPVQVFKDYSTARLYPTVADRKIIIPSIGRAIHVDYLELERLTPPVLSEEGQSSSLLVMAQKRVAVRKAMRNFEGEPSQASILAEYVAILDDPELSTYTNSDANSRREMARQVVGHALNDLLPELSALRKEAKVLFHTRQITDALATLWAAHTLNFEKVNQWLDQGLDPLSTPLKAADCAQILVKSETASNQLITFERARALTSLRSLRRIIYPKAMVLNGRKILEMQGL